MDANIRVILCLLIIYCLHVPAFDTAQAKLNIHQTSEFELLKRIKAADIRSWIDPSINPCKDFYGYACGKWDRIYAGQVQKQFTVNKYDIYNSAMSQRIKHFLMDLSADNFIQNKILNFIESCRETKHNISNFRQDVLNVIRSEFGEFSYLKNAGEQKMTKGFSWWSTAAKIFSVFDESLFVKLDVDYHLKTRHRTSIFLGKPTKGKFLTTKRSIEKRFKEFFGVSTPEAQRIAYEVHELSESMQDAGTDNTKSGLAIDELYILTNLTDLKRQYHDLFDIESYLKIALNISFMPDQVYLEAGGYLDELHSILKDTVPVTVEHYFLNQILEKFTIDIESNDFDNECRTRAAWHFGKYIEHSIYQEFRSAEFENQIYELWQDIKSAFHSDLQGDKYQWISKGSRSHAIRKLNNIKFSISSYDDENFEAYFQSLPIDPKNYPLNVLNAYKHYTAHRGKRLEIRGDSLEDVVIYSYTPAYMPSRHEIRIPVSFFQPFHIWHPSYPKAILYAHMGAPIGHEIIHAFDDSGRHFDAEGNANNWWDANASKEYEIRRRCFQAQYHNYSFAGHRLPDLQAQGENIADNAAVRIAHSAYLRWLEKASITGQDREEQFINWPDVTGEELFFISFGQYRCQSVDDELIESLIKDVHAPHRLRVIGPLSNFPKFSEVFMCPDDSPMNPSKKCEIF